MSSFQEPYTCTKSKTKIELDLSTYAAKSDIRRDTCNDVSEVAKTADLAGLKSEVDKTDAGKLEIVPFNLRKLSNLVKKMLKILHMIN